MLVGAAFVGRGFNYVMSSRRPPAVRVQPVPVQVETGIGSPGDSGALAADPAQIEAQEIALDSGKDEVFPAESFFDSLHLVRDSNTPFPSRNLTVQKLRLQYSRPVPADVRAQIGSLYKSWKWRQGEEVTQVERLMELYAPGARIFCAPGYEVSRDEFRTINLEIRNSGIFFSATDQKPIEWAQNAGGNRVELLAYHLYRDDSGNKMWGQRHLVWQKRGKRWLIIRDEFPPRYWSDQAEPVAEPQTVVRVGPVQGTTAQDSNTRNTNRGSLTGSAVPSGFGNSSGFGF